MYVFMFVVAAVVAVGVGVFVLALCRTAAMATPSPLLPELVGVDLEMARLERQVAASSAARLYLVMAQGREDFDPVDVRNVAGAALAEWSHPNADLDNGSPYWPEPSPAELHSHGVRASRLMGFEGGGAA